LFSKSPAVQNNATDRSTWMKRER